MASSGVLSFAATVLVAFCLIVAAPGVDSAVSCGQVASNLGPCLAYVIGKAPLTAQCCGGLKALAGQAVTTPDRQAVCGCIKSAAAKVSGIVPGNAVGLPRKCGVSVPYAISPSIDCSKIH